MVNATTNKLKHWSDDELISLLQAHHDVRTSRGADAEFLPLDDLVEDTFATFSARQEQLIQQHQHHSQSNPDGDGSDGFEPVVRRPAKAVYDKLYGLVSSYKFVTDYEEDRINRERSAIGSAIQPTKKPWWDLTPSDHRRILGKNRVGFMYAIFFTGKMLTG